MNSHLRAHQKTGTGLGDALYVQIVGNPFVKKHILHSTQEFIEETNPLFVMYVGKVATMNQYLPGIR